MKTNKISIAFALATVVFTACQQKLPYDLKGTEHGVVINIRKVQGSSTTLSTDMNDGDYKVLLSIPEQQGDYSMLKEAQIMAIYTDGAKNKKSAKIVTGIKEFPYTATIDIADACSKLGVSTIQIGDRIEFTPCVTLNSGTQVDGWSELGGFNNTLFTGWQLPDGPFSYRVAYTAFAPFYKDHYQGNNIPWISDFGETGTANVTQITDLPPEKWIPSGVTASDLVGLRVEGDLFFSVGVLGTSLPDEGITMWINTQDYTLILPDQTVTESFQYPGMGDEGKGGFFEEGEGEVDTLNETVTFYFVPTFGDGYWFGGGFTMELQF